MPIFKKNILKHQKFYIASFSKKVDAPYLIFIHGGPGFNCATVEYLIEYEDFFKALDCNIIVYDQRGCGRSTEYFKCSGKVVHADNVNDLQEVYQYLTKVAGFQIKGLIGHSYGAKLLFDFLKKTKLIIPSIFVSTANSILTPRLNNLISDLGYLKKIDVKKYQEIIAKIDGIDIESIWKLTEEL